MRLVIILLLAFVYTRSAFGELTCDKATATLPEEKGCRKDGGRFKKDEKSKVKKSKKLYAKIHVTNDLDYVLHSQLDTFERTMNTSPKKAHNQFKVLYREFKSPRALFGMASALNKLAIQTMEKSKNLAKMSKDELSEIKEKRTKAGEAEPTMLALTNQPHEMSRSERTFHRSHERREEAVNHQIKAGEYFCQVLTLEDVPTFLFLTSGKNCLEVMRHWNRLDKLEKALLKMSDKFSSIMEYPSELSRLLMMTGRFEKAEKVLRKLVERWPNAELEKCLLGLDLKLKNIKKEVNPEKSKEMDDFLQNCFGKTHLKTQRNLFSEIGSALQRISKLEESNFVFDLGFEAGLFLSKWQRSDAGDEFQVRRLSAKPVWKIEGIGPDRQEQLTKLAKIWRKIKREANEAWANKRDQFNLDSNVDVVGRHNWHEMILYQFGSLNEVACSSAPDTCQAVNQVLPESVTCSRCEIKFVVLQPGGHLPPHSGPSNTRLRCFLGLVVPDDDDDAGFVDVRVGGEAKLRNPFKVAEFFVIDDSFETEIRNRSKRNVILLAVDVLHPDLSQDEIGSLQPLKAMPRRYDFASILRVSNVVNDVEETVILNSSGVAL